MRSKKLSLELTVALAVFTTAMLMTGTPAAAQTEKVLHNFGSNTKARVGPASNLIFDSAGNLYGTTVDGGNDDVGTAFELIPVTGGGWAQKVLYSFAKNGADGQGPEGGLVFDSAGNLYGTTAAGGANGVGTVFELTPPVPPSTQWTEQVLYSFLDNNMDGQNPTDSLIFDPADNLYGITLEGGRYAVGTVFELSPATSGGWTEAVVHSFSPNINGEDGYDPRSGLTIDSSGNLYGTTLFGGSLGGGTVFEFTPSTGGAWTETILYNFADNSVDGGLPAGGLIFDSAGNLYGTTTQGGPTSGGTVFKLTPSSGGSWTETVLYYFLYNNSTDGYNPYGNLTFDSEGDLCGATLVGGTGSCGNIGCGIVFKLRPASPLWIERVAHHFDENGTDGYFPESGVVSGPDGGLYGTTFYGGLFNDGTVFVVKP